MKEALAALIQSLNQRGWSPATSTNYSFIDEHQQCWVSRSGVNKAQFEATDFMTIDSDGMGIGAFHGVKPSDETKIHLWIYQHFPAAKVILHSHGKYPVLISQYNEHFFSVQGYELQKGFKGCKSHLDTLQIPIIDNQQDMDVLCQDLTKRVADIQQHCFIIAGHGTYAWGENLFEAQRHLETLDYLCECEFLL
ncbi:MAG: methylthioribulose 1-phosphate dehydratase [Bacteroidota bacterium]|jgi:methylthioribulose-1-phosphate dehydratase